MDFIKKFPLIVLSFLLLNPAGASKVYKWVDENGQVHYGEKPLNEEKVDEVKIKNSSNSSEPADPSERMQKQQELIRAYGEERRIKNEEKEKASQKKKKLNRNCKIAKQNYKDYVNIPRLYRHDKDGNRVFLSDDERKNNLAQMKKAIDAHCK